MTTTGRLKLRVGSILHAYDEGFLIRGGTAAMLVLAIVQAARASSRAPKATVRWMAKTAGTSDMTVIDARRRGIEIGFLDENGDFPEDPTEAADPNAEAAMRERHRPTARLGTAKSVATEMIAAAAGLPDLLAARRLALETAWQ